MFFWGALGLVVLQVADPDPGGADEEGACCSPCSDRSCQVNNIFAVHN